MCTFSNKSILIYFYKFWYFIKISSRQRQIGKVPAQKTKAVLIDVDEWGISYYNYKLYLFSLNRRPQNIRPAHQDFLSMAKGICIMYFLQNEWRIKINYIIWKKIYDNEIIIKHFTHQCSWISINMFYSLCE